MLIAGPADAQRMAREDSLGQRLFILNLMMDCPGNLGAERLRSLVDRTREAILRAVPGARGEGVIAGINSGLIVARSGLFFTGNRDDICRGLASIFTDAAAQAARE
ncbi:MAG TPA: hypothetical protein VGM87_09370 [Roseomonas sp.]